MCKVLGIAYRAISNHLTHKAGLQIKDGATGAVTLILRFGSALNLNIHFHVLFLDGVYVYRDSRPLRFQRVRAPDRSELEDLVHLISQRASSCLELLGLLEQDTERRHKTTPKLVEFYPSPGAALRCYATKHMLQNSLLLRPLFYSTAGMAVSEAGNAFA